MSAEQTLGRGDRSISAVDRGPLIYRQPGGTDQRFQVRGGYIEIRYNLVTVLTEQIED